MKTSTKLLIIFFSCIPLSLIAYNYLLKQQYLAGYFVQDFLTEGKPPISKAVPAFKHVVIDGALNVGDTVFNKTNSRSSFTTTNITSWMPKIMIQDLRSTKPGNLEIPEIYQDVVRSSVRNDTLYITFHKKKVKESDYRYSNSYGNVVTINGNGIRSISGSNCNYTLLGPSLKRDSLKLSVLGNSYCNINNLNLDHLDVIASGLAHVYIYGGNKVDKLSYSLRDRSVLFIDSYNTIGSFKPVRLDSLTKITIDGPASVMQQYLKGMTTSKLDIRYTNGFVRPL